VDDRRFGYWVGHFVVVNCMVGGGILTTSGLILHDTGNVPALLGLWVLGGVIAICGALTIAEMATALPRTGGDYVFVREAYGRGAGFVSGWGTFMLGFCAPVAFLANLCVTYLTEPFIPALTARLPAGLVELIVPLSASALILLMGMVHSLGHTHSSRLQLAATLLTFTVLIAISGGGLFFGTGSWAHFAVGGWPRGSEWSKLAAGSIMVAFTYGGWNAAGYLAGEIRMPAVTLPRCLIGGATTVMALYLFVNVAYVYALDPVAMTEKSEDDAKPVARLAAAAFFGPETGGTVSFLLGIGLLGSVSAGLLAGPRIVVAMAQDRVFPRYAGALHATRRTPIAATLTEVVVSISLVWIASFRQLLDYASVGFVAISGLTIASVFAIRRRPDLPHPYLVPLYPLPPLIYLILVVITVGIALVDPVQQKAAFYSLGTILVGIPLARLLPKAK
jgi:APA family basic amino acid/polyamine antiporter